MGQFICMTCILKNNSSLIMLLQNPTEMIEYFVQSHLIAGGEK